MEYVTPDGYFNATDLLPKDDQGRRVLKVAHYLDNDKTKTLLAKIGKDPITKRGRGACTFLPNEIKTAYLAWLNPENLLNG